MQKMKPALKKTLMAVACLSAVPAAQAAVSWTAHVRFLMAMRNR